MTGPQQLCVKHTLRVAYDCFPLQVTIWIQLANCCKARRGNKQVLDFPQESCQCPTILLARTVLLIFVEYVLSVMYKVAKNSVNRKYANWLTDSLDPLCTWHLIQCKKRQTTSIAEDFCLLGCNAVSSSEWFSTFRRSVLPSFPRAMWTWHCDGVTDQPIDRQLQRDVCLSYLIARSGPPVNWRSLVFIKFITGGFLFLLMTQRR